MTKSRSALITAADGSQPPTADIGSARRTYGAVKLAVATAIVTVFWLVILPWCSRQPRMAQHLRWLDERGIDPSAMFYTDLKAVEPLYCRTERSRTKVSPPQSESQ